MFLGNDLKVFKERSELWEMMYKGPIKKSDEDLPPCRCEKKIFYFKDEFIGKQFSM